MPRHFRRSRPRQVYAKTFKKVLNFAPSSHGAGVIVDNQLCLGTDAIAIGQTTPTDATVPTGSIIESFVVQYGAVNLSAISCFHHYAMQYTIGSQSLFVPPNLVGGNNQRNQVIKQNQHSMGQGQNYNVILRFKIPRKFQRIKEGMRWTFSSVATSAITDSIQVIYTVKQ